MMRKSFLPKECMMGNNIFPRDPDFDKKDRGGSDMQKTVYGEATI